MNTTDYGNLTYLVLLGAVLVFWMFVQNRESLGKKLQQLAAWAFIFIGVIAVIGLWGDIRTTINPRQAVFADTGSIELPRAPDGHYYITLTVNNVPINFVVDTGATNMVLTMKDAGRAGLKSDDLVFFSEAMTANGAVRTAPVKLDRVAVGPFVDQNVRAFVNSGDMEKSLLGMTYLSNYSRLEISNGKMVLER